MAWALFGANPLSKPTLSYCQLNPHEQYLVKFNQNTKLFIHEVTSEDIVREILSFSPVRDELIVPTSYIKRNGMPVCIVC